MLKLDIFKCDVNDTQFESCPEDVDDYFDNKSIMLLINNKHADFDTAFRDPEIIEYTDMYFTPLSQDSPALHRVQLVRNRIELPSSQMERSLGIDRGYKSYVSVSEDSMEDPFPLNLRRKFPNRIAEIEFSTSSNLVLQARQFTYIFDSLALIGGHFGALRILFGFFFSMFMPWLGQLEILKSVFLVDPSKGNPLSVSDLNSKKPKDLLDTARSIQKKRRKISYSNFERVWLGIEAIFKHLNCRKSKFAKMSTEGFGQVK